MRSHWSLVAFILLVQAAVGSVWCMQLVAFMAVLVGFLLKVLAAGVNSFERTNGAGLVKTSLPVMQEFGSAFFANYDLSAGSTSFQAAFLSLAALSLVTGEIIHRVRFYNSYPSIGLSSYDGNLVIKRGELI